jgi:hypothetical protein
MNIACTLCRIRLYIGNFPWVDLSIGDNSPWHNMGRYIQEDAMRARTAVVEPRQNRGGDMPNFTVTLSGRVFSRFQVEGDDHLDAAKKARARLLAMTPADRWKRSDYVEQMDFDVEREDGDWEFIEDIEFAEEV